MITILWFKGLLFSRAGRLLGAILGVAITVALLATIGAFTVKSAASMTARAIASIPVDWQIQLAPNTDPKTVINALGQSTSYTALQQVNYADSIGFSANTNNTVQTTGAGKVLGINPQYIHDFPTQLRPLIGSLDGVLVAQQTAANLQVTVGDTVTIQRVGLPDVTVKVDGVVDLPNADSLFQAVGIAAGVAPQAPPDNVLLLPMTQWQQFLAPQAANRPDSIKGAKSHQIGAFLWSEGLLILVSGSVAGMIIGFGVAQMLVKVLTGVFDPPPDFLSVPWKYLVLLVVAASISTMVAVSAMQIVSRRVGVEALRDI